MRRILVIEDDPDIALSLRLKLERDGGFAVEIAMDPHPALRATLSLKGRGNPTPKMRCCNFALPMS